MKNAKQILAAIDAQIEAAKESEQASRQAGSSSDLERAENYASAESWEVAKNRLQELRKEVAELLTQS